MTSVLAKRIILRRADFRRIPSLRHLKTCLCRLRHCAAAFSLQVPKSCTHIDQAFLYISVLRTYTNFSPQTFGLPVSRATQRRAAQLDVFTRPKIAPKSPFRVFSKFGLIRLHPLFRNLGLAWTRQAKKKKKRNRGKNPNNLWLNANGARRLRC